MLRLVAATALVSCLFGGTTVAGPLFENSIASNDIDFIVASDPTVPGCLRYLRQTSQEMPGALDTEGLVASGVYTFEVAFFDRSNVGIWVHPSVGGQEEAEDLATKLVGPLGQLPAIMRHRLSHVVVHSGYHTAFAEHLGHFFVVYADNVQKRIENHDLEETVFHESVHATLDAEWADSAEWRRAQATDGGFITDYAEAKPNGEDFAESALFAYTYLRHPERLPPDVVSGIQTIMPARLSFFEAIFGGPEPAFSIFERPQACLAL
jgi:hypothetical protein